MPCDFRLWWLAPLFLSIPASFAASPVTGQAVPELSGLDTAMQNEMSKYAIPGGALAVSRNGTLIYARGFGYADVASKTLVQPDSLFRIASVSKTFTAVATMVLVQDGKIQLDQPAFALLPIQSIPNVNPELANVTVRDLLDMTGGWDRSIVPDALDRTLQISQALNFPSPLACRQIIGYMVTQPVQHTPGSTYAYSNFGYCVLGAIVAEVSGMNYEDYVRQQVLQPMGIGRAKEADGLLSDTVNGEVTYYDYPGAPRVENVYNPGGPKVPSPYGGHDFISAQAAGGWVTTPIDLLRFAKGIPAVLNPATISAMEAEAPAFNGAAGFYGLGFNMHPSASGKGLNWSKDGGLPGTSAYLFIGADGLSFAVVFNSAPSGASEESAGNNFEGDYVKAIESALATVKSWPTTDQFANFNSTLAPPQFRASDAVQNAASFQPAITSGSWVALYGTNLSTASRTWYASEFSGSTLPYNVDSVEVTINGQAAPVYYVSPGQLNVQAPKNLPLGTVSIQVQHDGQLSDPVMAQVVAAGPALFTYPSGANTYIAARFINDKPTPDNTVIGDPSVTPGTVEAKPNDYLELFGTGFGPSPAGSIITTPVTLNPYPTVTVAGNPVSVSYAGLVGAGLFQINIQLPSLLSAGNQPIVVKWGGATSPDGVTLPIASQ